MSRELARFRFFFRYKNYRDEFRRYALLLVLPIVLCVILFFGVRQVISRQMLDRAELQTDHFYTQTSAMLREMQIVSDSLLRNGTFLNALSAESAGDVDSFALCALIRESMEESPYISHVYVISERLDHIYTDESSYSYRALPVMFQRIGAEYADILDDAELSTNYAAINNKTNLAPYYIAPILYGDENLGTVVVTLRMTEFLRIFFSLDADLCTVFNDEFYISSYLYTIPGDWFNWRSPSAVSELLGDSTTCFYRDAGQYTYLVGLSNRAYNRPLDIILYGFFIYEVIVLAAGFIYLYRVSKKRFLQLNSLVEALPERRTGDYSSQEVYDDIHKSLLDFRDQNENARQVRERRSLHNLLYGYYGDQITQEKLDEVRLNRTAPGFYVAAFYIVDACQLVPSGGKPDAFEMAHVIMRSTLTSLSAGKTDIRFCDDTRDAVTVLFIAEREEGFGALVEQICSNAVALVRENYSIYFQGTVSRRAADVRELPEAFSETQRLHNFARTIDSGAPLILEEKLLSEGGQLLSGDFLRQEQILLNALLAGKYRVIPSMVEGILAEHVSPLAPNYSLAHDRLATVSGTLAEGVMMANLHGMSPEEAAQLLRQSDSVQTLCAAAERVFSRMAELSETPENNDVLSRACAYIHEHISDQNLNVNAICEEAGVSVQRLTRMFQAQYDMAVAEYMNFCRIQRAKELLQDRQLSVVQIAEKVGYGNTDTLTRNFRKREGITPSEYRKLLP